MGTDTTQVCFQFEHLDILNLHTWTLLLLLQQNVRLRLLPLISSRNRMFDEEVVVNATSRIKDLQEKKNKLLF